MNRVFEATSKMMSQENTKNIELANFLQVSPQVFGNWVARESIPEKYAAKIAEYYKVDISYFYGKETQIIKKVPIISAVNCGSGSISEKIGGFAPYKGSGKIEKLYCLVAKGSNMSPEIEDGDEIICEKDVKISNGDIVHYTIDDENAVKIYIKDEDANIIQFVPYIQTKDFKTKTIRLDDKSPNLIIAKVTAINKIEMKNTEARLK
ncbi:MAG: helix-turn-helix domain-containing protein, partial [Campylobacteraceae bacterium]|nr:helix-turn-helix domain-containing protein [Campylobacteraceae bacterium]